MVCSTTSILGLPGSSGAQFLQLSVVELCIVLRIDEDAFMVAMGIPLPQLPPVVFEELWGWVEVVPFPDGTVVDVYQLVEDAFQPVSESLFSPALEVDVDHPEVLDLDIVGLSEFLGVDVSPEFRHEGEEACEG